MSKLAVKYRPTTFEDVIGQDLNTKILSRQIEQKDLPVGYLFSGGSGVGKTTVARILASKLDAEVIEIDGASNNSVDNVRQIRDNTKLHSISSNGKVYIIDEAHMLSKGAFNALLKTLEEPPKGVLFILATTEPEKLPATIHSRLQHFKFSRVHWEKIEKRLEYIVEQEEEKIGGDVIQYIAKLADGGVRSAIGILEKAMKLDDPGIEEITELAGAVNYRKIFELFDVLLNKQDMAELLELIEGLHSSGVNLERFIEQSSHFVVELTKYAVFGNFEYIKIPVMYEEDLDRILEVVKEGKKPLRGLFNDFNKLSKLLKYETDKKLLIEGKLMQYIGGN